MNWTVALGAILTFSVTMAGILTWLTSTMEKEKVALLEWLKLGHEGWSWIQTSPIKSTRFQFISDYLVKVAYGEAEYYMRRKEGTIRWELENADVSDKSST